MSSPFVVVHDPGRALLSFLDQPFLAEYPLPIILILHYNVFSMVVSWYNDREVL